MYAFGLETVSVDLRLHFCAFLEKISEVHSVISIINDLQWTMLTQTDNICHHRTCIARCYCNSIVKWTLRMSFTFTRFYVNRNWNVNMAEMTPISLPKSSAYVFHSQYFSRFFPTCPPSLFLTIVLAQLLFHLQV